MYLTDYSCPGVAISEASALQQCLVNSYWTVVWINTRMNKTREKKGKEGEKKGRELRGGMGGLCPLKSQN